MKGIVIAGLVPHPPLLIPAIGGKDLMKISSTKRAMVELAQKIKEADVEILVTISPHGPIFSDAISILKAAELEGSFAAYGVNEVRLKSPLAEDLIALLIDEAAKSGFPLKLIDGPEADRYQIPIALDHGIMVPLYYLQRVGINVPLLPINIGLLSLKDLFDFGLLMQEVLQNRPKRIAVLASGDLSHRLTPNAPAGYSPRGREFDRLIMNSIEDDSLTELLNIETSLVEKAGECGLRPLIILAGIIHGLGFKGKVLSYEGPFGVGYGIAHFAKKENGNGQITPPDLARRAVNYYLQKGAKMAPPPELPKYLQEKHGAFVSIKKKSGELRGCIGTLKPTQPNLAMEIIKNAIGAATADPRFSAITADESADLIFSVDVLMPPQVVSSPRELDHREYGIIVEKDGRKGVLLPDIPGVNSVEEQLTIARMKAGIKYDEEITIKKFRVDRY